MKEKMSKLDINRIKHSGYLVFDNKEKMLKYIKKSSFSDETNDYMMIIRYVNRKWIVSWR